MKSNTQNKQKSIILMTVLALALALAIAVTLPLSVFAAISDNQAPLIDNRKVEGWPSDKAPGMNCVTAFAMEANTGAIVFSKDGDRSMHPASITKVMTALIVIENCNLDDMVTFESKDVDYLEEGGNNWKITWKGETLSVRDCLYALMLESVNECGMALARHTAGSVEAFCAMMNEKAASLGCTGTNFTNPHGLNDSEHVTTAHDMVLIFRACLQNETFYEIATTLRYKIEGTELNPGGMSCYMHNRMMRTDSEYYNEYVLAGKTGYTSICGNTLVTYAEKDGMQLVICVLKGTSAGGTYKDTKNIIDYAADNFMIADMDEVTSTFVGGLNTRNMLRLEYDGNTKLFVPKSFEGKMNLHYEPSSGAPDYPDGVVGTVYYQINGQTLSTVRVMGYENPDAKKADEDNNSGFLGLFGNDKESENGEGSEAASAARQDGKEGRPKTVLAVLVVFCVLTVLVAIWAVSRYMRNRRLHEERMRTLAERRRRMRSVR